jgi:hypothetical protein
MVDLQANTDLDGGVMAQTSHSWRNGTLGISKTKCFVFLVEGIGEGDGSPTSTSSPTSEKLRIW